MLGAAVPWVIAGDPAVRGVLAAQPLGVLALVVASVAALVALTVSTTCCRPAHGSPTVVLLPSGARVHGVDGRVGFFSGRPHFAKFHQQLSQ